MLKYNILLQNVKTQNFVRSRQQFLINECIKAKLLWMWKTGFAAGSDMEQDTH